MYIYILYIYTYGDKRILNSNNVILDNEPLYVFCFHGILWGFLLNGLNMFEPQAIIEFIDPLGSENTLEHV